MSAEARYPALTTRGGFQLPFKIDGELSLGQCMRFRCAGNTRNVRNGSRPWKNGACEGGWRVCFAGGQQMSDRKKRMPRTCASHQRRSNAMGRSSLNRKLKTSGVTISRHSANPNCGLIERKIDVIKVLWLATTAQR